MDYQIPKYFLNVTDNVIPEISAFKPINKLFSLIFSTDISDTDTISLVHSMFTSKQFSSLPIIYPSFYCFLIQLYKCL